MNTITIISNNTANLFKSYKLSFLLVTARFPIRISAETPTVRTEALNGDPQLLQAHSWITPQNKPRLFSFTIILIILKVTPQRR